ncbi:MAG: Colicin secretion protein CvaA [Pseudomonadota bacterium]|jgi:membrane fusion protein
MSGGRPVTASLFREEVLRAHTAQHLGTIRIGHPPRHTFVAGVALVLAGALVAFAAWAQVTRKARVPGLLVPRAGTVHVPAPAAGAVLERRIAEGDEVAPGQVLFVLDTGRIGPHGEVGALVGQALQQREASLQAELSLRLASARQRERALADRLQAIEREAAQAQGESALARRRVELAERSAERYRQLAASGFVSELQAQARQEELLELQARAQAAERAGTVLARERQSAQAEADAHGTQWRTERVQLERALSQLSQERRENDTRSRLVVTTAVPGTATAVHAPAGSPVQPGQTLVTIVPRATPEAHRPNGSDASAPELEAELYAPSRTAGFLQAGQSAWLRVAAFPYQKFGMAAGKVVSVSRTPVNPQDLPAGHQQALLAAAQSAEPLFRIRVALQAPHLPGGGRLPPLRPGMWVEADIVQERRAVWEWMLEPVLGTRTRWAASSREGS